MVIREISSAEKGAFNNSAAHITQSFQWGESRLKTGVREISRLGVFDGKKMIRGYQIFFHTVPLLANLIAYLPRTVMPPKEDWEAITKACREKGAAYLKLEPTADSEYQIPGVRPGDAILPRHSLVVDLTPTEEEILTRMHEKTRYNIKLAQKAGVIVEEKDDPQSLENFIELYGATQKRQGFFAKNGDYIRTLWEVLRPAKMVYLLGAYVEREMVAAGVFFNFGGTFYFPYGGWSAEHREKMPNNLLHFEAMKLAKKLGAKKYDFWSSYKNTADPTDPWYGTYVFKKGFGGEEQHFPGAYDMVFNQPGYLLTKIADQIRWPIYRIKRIFNF